MSGQATILIDDPAITRLSIYVDGDCSLTGKGTIGDTTTYKAAQLIIYAQDDDDVTLGGGGTFVGGLFAKRAKVRMTGGATVYGAVAADKIDANGSYTFYFDKALKNLASGQTGAAGLQVWTARKIASP